MSKHEIPPEHVIPPGLYLGVFAALMVLTGLTVWVAFYDLGALNVAVALGIALSKTVLVVLYFMHVRYSSRLTQTIVMAGLFFFVILIAFTFADYLTRGWDTALEPPG